MSGTHRPPIGRALCLGVDAEADARAFAALASERGFDAPALLLGEGGTLAAVRAKLAEMAAISEPGDLFLLTFSGHGGRTKRRGPAGESREVGFWQLLDGTLNDEQLKAELVCFRPGVRVLVVSDNCGGGVPSLRPSQLDTSLSASVLVLAACQEGKCADGAGLPGHFTRALTGVLNGAGLGGAFGRACSRTYSQFHEALCTRMPDYQKPDFYRVGAIDAAFETQEPFSI
ncbi:MAG: caspase family protein [Gammaproteobacteria bacterium]